jgi:hypothetical protein
MSVSFSVANPRGEIRAKEQFPLAKRLDSLNGKKLVLYSNGKPGMDNLYAVLAEKLKAQYPDISVIMMTGGFLIRDDDAQKIANEMDGFVYGVGD